MTLVYFILILGITVFIHELGHFIWSKIFHVYVYEFAIGMGPKIFSKKGKNGETVYSLRAIPLGGFCQLAGEDTETDEKEKIPRERTLQGISVWKRFLIMFFGAGNNFLLAMLILFMMGLIWGAPNTKPIITSIEENSPIQKAGFEVKDTILKIDGHKVYTTDDASMYFQLADINKEVKVEVKKENGTIKTYKVKPEKIEKQGVEIPRYGVGMAGEMRHGIFASIDYMIQKTGSLFRQMGVVVSRLFTGGISVKQLSGPVGIYNLVGEQSKAGIENLIYLIAYLSINVGFINLIPFPAFDGGRILFLLIEKIKGSPVSPNVENTIHSIGFLLLIALMIYITINDVVRLF